MSKRAANPKPRRVVLEYRAATQDYSVREAVNTFVPQPGERLTPCQVQDLIDDPMMTVRIVCSK